MLSNLNWPVQSAEAEGVRIWIDWAIRSEEVKASKFELTNKEEGSNTSEF